MNLVIDRDYEMGICSGIPDWYIKPLTPKGVKALAKISKPLRGLDSIFLDIDNKTLIISAWSDHIAEHIANQLEDIRI